MATTDRARSGVGSRSGPTPTEFGLAVFPFALVLRGGIPPRFGPRWLAPRLDPRLHGSDHLGRPDPVVATIPSRHVGGARDGRADLLPAHIAGPVGPIPPPTVVWTVRVIRVIWMSRVIRMIRMIRVVRVVRMIWVIGPIPAAPVSTTVGRLVGPIAPWQLARRRNHPANIAVGHSAAGVVVHRAFTHPRDDPVGARAVAVLEDEPRLGPERPDKYRSCAVIAVGVVIGIVVHDDAEAHAGVRVGVPRGPPRVRVTIVAQEPGIVVVLLDVIGNDVVVPVGVVGRDDALREIGQRHVRIAAHPAVGHHAVVPMVAALERVVDERIRRRDGEEIANAGVVVDLEHIAGLVALHLELPPTADVVVLPWLAGEQHADAAVGVDAQQREVGILVRADEDANPVTSGVGIVAAAGPDLDAGPIGNVRGARCAGRWLRPAGTRHSGQSEQRDVSEHMTSHRGSKAGSMPGGFFLYSLLSQPLSILASSSLFRLVSSILDVRPLVSFPHA